MGRERRKGEEEDRDDVEELRRVGGGRSGEFPCPVQKEMGLREGVSIYSTRLYGRKWAMR